VIGLRVSFGDEIVSAEIRLATVVDEARLVAVQATIDAEWKESFLGRMIQLPLVVLVFQRVVHIEQIWATDLVVVRAADVTKPLRDHLAAVLGDICAGGDVFKGEEAPVRPLSLLITGANALLETLAVCFFDQHLPLILVVAVDEPIEAVVLEPSTDTARA
jgi:hypothetical protein